jgi:hypothetical protein
VIQSRLNDRACHKSAGALPPGNLKKSEHASAVKQIYICDISTIIPPEFRRKKNSIFRPFPRLGRSPQKVAIFSDFGIASLNSIVDISDIYANGICRDQSMAAKFELHRRAVGQLAIIRPSGGINSHSR